MAPRLILAVVLCLLPASIALADPAGPWQRAAPSAWSDAASRAVQAYAATHRPTAVMVVRDGLVVAAWGDVGRKVNLRSVRKSLIGMLYGIGVAEGRIDLSRTLEQLGIDDEPPALTQAEKRATLRDLLMARSGVYHAAAYETSDIRAKRPARGSHPPGTFWFYNNWDFNVLGTIYRKVMGEDIFASFERRIAHPIGMEDFSAHDGRYVREAVSIHPAYPFSMSARDLARFGLLVHERGRWNGRQIVPAAWIEQAAAALSATDREGRGYGYLWWSLSSAQWGAGAALASGYGGQALAVVPSKHLVVVQTVDLEGGARGLRTTAFLALARAIADGAP